MKEVQADGAKLKDRENTLVKRSLAQARVFITGWDKMEL